MECGTVQWRFTKVGRRVKSQLRENLHTGVGRT
jgi:hypothetical protein